MDIIILAIDYLPQDWSQFEEGLVLHVIAEPRLDLNAIFRLSAEVLRHIVDDDDPFQVPAEQGQIFEVHWAVRHGVLSVKSELHALRGVEIVDDPVCVLLQRSGPNDDLVTLCHQLEELARSWPDHEVASAEVIDHEVRIALEREAARPLLLIALTRVNHVWLVEVVDQRLVEVEDECVGLIHID